MKLFKDLLQSVKTKLYELGLSIFRIKFVELDNVSMLLKSIYDDNF